MNNYQKFLINIIVGSFWGLISNVVIGIFLILTLGSIIGFNYLEYILVSSILCISYNYFNPFFSARGEIAISNNKGWATTHFMSATLAENMVINFNFYRF